MFDVHVRFAMLTILQAGKLSGHDATQKQSYSRQDMKLDHIGEVHNTFRFDDCA